VRRKPRAKRLKGSGRERFEKKVKKVLRRVRRGGEHPHNKKGCLSEKRGRNDRACTEKRKKGREHQKNHPLEGKIKMEIRKYHPRGHRNGKGGEKTSKTETSQKRGKKKILPDIHRGNGRT